MARPLIGISTQRYDSDSRHTRDVCGKSFAYIQAVSRAGGLPVLIPLGLPDHVLRELFARLDGVLLSGGGDIHPDRFGGGSHPRVHEIDPDRDRTEIALAQWAGGEGKPFLGICRGAQVINVAFGGKLHLDIEAELPNALKHDYYPDYPYDHLAHPIAVAEDSLLARIVGTPIVQVNSMHHQSVRDAAPKLLVTARAPDGVIEALELPGHPFGLGVQWHPEQLPDHPEMQRLFRAFVASSQ